MTPRYPGVLLAGCMLFTPAIAAGNTPDTHRPSVQAGQQYVPAFASDVGQASPASDRLAIFTPTSDPIRTTIDYEVWDFALKNIVLSMGPSSREGAPWPEPVTGTRIKRGPQSRYRLEGSLVLFRFFDRKVIDSFGEYRRDLEQVADTVDIAALPRNEQLAFWFNLHNVALMEHVAAQWPVREPRKMTVDGVPLDEARFITLRGIPVSLRDIRENIVFRHWKDPKVIYGFWRGEIGGPHLQSYAYTGGNVGSLLDLAAADFVNSLRGTQRFGNRLQVSQLYAEVAPFYFPDFERDLRAHLARYAEEPVADLLARTSGAAATIREPDIADLHGGARPPGSLFLSSLPGAMDDPLIGCGDKMGQAACDVMLARAAKLQRLQRKGQPVSRVFFSNIDLPGDPPNKNAVE